MLFEASWHVVAWYLIVDDQKFVRQVESEVLGVLQGQLTGSRANVHRRNADIVARVEQGQADGPTAGTNL